MLDIQEKWEKACEMATVETKILRMAEVKKILNMSRMLIDEFIKKGELKCVRLTPRGNRFFDPDEVERFRKCLFGKAN